MREITTVFLLFLAGCGARSELDAPSSVGANDEACAPASDAIVVLASGLDAPSALAVDGVAAYWTTGVYGAHDGTVQRCGLCGCNDAPVTLVSGLDWNPGYPIFPTPSIAVDAHDVYFSGADKIWHCSVRGCGGEKSPLASLQSPGGIATDGARVFWTNWELDPSTVMAVDTTSLHLATTASMDGTAEFGSIIVAGDALFWLDFDAVLTCPKSGCAAPTRFATASAAVNGLATDGAFVYWANRYPSADGGVALARCPIAGCDGAPQTLVSDLPDDHFRAIATDGADVFWVDTYDGTVLACAVTGCAVPTVLAAHQAFPEAIAVDATSLYWTNGGTNDTLNHDGSIMKLRKPR